MARKEWHRIRRGRGTVNEGARIDIGADIITYLDSSMDVVLCRTYNKISSFGFSESAQAATTDISVNQPSVPPIWV